MEGLATCSSAIKKIQGRKVSLSNAKSDLWTIAREGSLSELDLALMQLKRNGGNVDARNTFGLTALHIATWRNHVPIVKRLLAAGADPDARDGESGWTSLHRALHFGHLAVAGVLLNSGASLTLEDSKCRTPVDLLCGPVCQVVGAKDGSAITEVFSWGNGANYQLGTGKADIQKLPCKVDALQGTHVKFVAAAKFHSVAVGASGELYTWGFGRGGRLGHPDFDVHSGQAAVITPRQVSNGLGSRRVRAVAAAKHHTVVATEGGEVFTWGSNREGQLGYTSVDTQPTPRRVSMLRNKVIAVAAANKHTAVVSESGEVFTWGCNKEGQLGYGTSNSASNYVPRVVECLKGKQFVSVSAAKYHTVVLGTDGEVYTWGNRLVTPRRVIISRNTKKKGSTPLKFHRVERLHVVAVAAGMVHSTALTSDGALFFWFSSDPDLRCQQLYSACSKYFVSISAGKYWTAAVSNTGDVYTWDGKKWRDDEAPVASRLHGIKHAISVSVGEAHILVVSSLYHPEYPPKSAEVAQNTHADKPVEELDGDFIFDNSRTDPIFPEEKNNLNRSVPSLKLLCQKAACEFLVEPRNAVQLLEIADAVGADELWRHCEDIALHNLNFIFSLLSPSIANTQPEILAKLEKSLDARSSEPWSHRRLPTPTATFPAVVNSEEDSDTGSPRLRSHQASAWKNCKVQRAGVGFLRTKNEADQAMSKQIRAIRKKLQQIEILEAKQSNGYALDEQQIAKLQTRQSLEGALVELGVPLEAEAVKSSSCLLAEGKGSKKGGSLKKHRRRTKQKPDVGTGEDQGLATPPSSIKGSSYLDNRVPEVKVVIEPKGGGGAVEEISFHEVGEKQPITDWQPTVHNLDKQPSPPKASSARKTRKKGGLSMFLSGALDDRPQEVVAPQTPKTEGPAWGGIKFCKGLASLRDIQEEQKASPGPPGIKVRDVGDGSSAERGGGSGGGGSIKLSSFFPGSASSPIAVASARSPASLECDKSTPPWAAAGTSPVLCRPSLRDIQLQQGKQQMQFTSHSPKTRSQGFSVGSPSEAALCHTPKETTPNRWYKAETDIPSSIRAIQIEEAAIKDLKRYYNCVKLVRKQPE
ncbi:unnamed protein product [Victoria cruziana]